MFIDPAITLAACNIRSTDTVAEFGAGSGQMTHLFSKLVPEGNVFAIEIQKEMVEHLAKIVKEHTATNMHVLWGDVEVLGGSKLASESIDVVVLSNILFQLEDKKGCIREVHRVLKQKGKVLLIDWAESFGGMGPAPHHVVTREVAEALFLQEGFTKISDAIPSGVHHYAILFHT